MRFVGKYNCRENPMAPKNSKKQERAVGGVGHWLGWVTGLEAVV